MKTRMTFDINTLFGRSVTFKQKILIVAIMGLILSSIVYTYSAVRTERSIIRQEVLKRAEVVTELASHIGELPLISENPEHMKKAVSSLTSIPEVSFIAFYDRSKNLLLAEGAINPFPREHPQDRMTIIERDNFFDLSTPVFMVRVQEDIQIFQDTDTMKEIRERTGWVRIGFSKAAMKKAENSIIRKGLLIAGIFTLISIIFIYKLFDVTTRPLTSLANAVKSISKGKYPEIPVTTQDEIGTLTSEFNRMAKSVKDREDLLVNQLHLTAFAADIGKSLTESDDLDAMLHDCINIIVRYLNPKLARIWILQENPHSLELRTSAGIYTILNSPRKTVPVGECEAGKIAETLTPHCTRDMDSLHPSDREWARHHGIVSYAGYPLIVERQLVGVIEICTAQFLEGDVLTTLNYVVNELALGIQHKLTELKISSSLREKEILLREIHHRVKNNMQVISSLLNLQSDQVKDQQHIAVFNESRNRILAMALVHEKLYRSEDFSNIDFRDYINSLVNGLFAFYNISEGQIKLELIVDSINLGLDAAIPCGLIINELVSNSLKHAFPGNRQGEIRISFSTVRTDGKDTYELKVKDNGAGVPKGMDFRKTSSLGLQLVTTLVEHQLQGSIEMFNNNGTEFKIHFNEPEYKKRL